MFLNIHITIVLLNSVLFLGCKDSQTSADTNVSGYGATGAASYAFIDAVRNSQNMWDALYVCLPKDDLCSSFENITTKASATHCNMKDGDPTKITGGKNEEEELNLLFSNKTMDMSWRVCYGTTAIILSFLLFLWFYFENFACSKCCNE